MLVTHCWDSEEFQQFACQVKPVSTAGLASIIQSYEFPIALY
jgi:hypothetical protein